MTKGKMEKVKEYIASAVLGLSLSLSPNNANADMQKYMDSVKGQIASLIEGNMERFEPTFEEKKPISIPQNPNITNTPPKLEKIALNEENPNKVSAEELYGDSFKVKVDAKNEHYLTTPVITTAEDLQSHPKEEWLKLLTGLTVEQIKEAKNGVKLKFKLPLKELQKLDLGDILGGFERVRIDGVLYENEGGRFFSKKLQKRIGSDKNPVGIVVGEDGLPKMDKKEFKFNRTKISLDTKNYDFENLNVEAFKDFLDFIRKCESGEDIKEKDSYNEFFHSSPFATAKMKDYSKKKGKKFTDMTLEEILVAQENLKRFCGQVENRPIGSGMGAFSLLELNIIILAEKYNISLKEIFTPETQKKLTLLLLREIGFEQFQKQRGVSSEVFVSKRIATFWASIPKDSTGKTVYGGVSSNPDYVDSGRYTKAVSLAEQMRNYNLYKKNI